MPKDRVLAGRQTSRAADQSRPRAFWVGSAALAAFSLATLAVGIACLLIHWRQPGTEHVLAPSGLICLFCFVAQVRIAVGDWHSGRIGTHENPLGQFRFWRRLLAGVFFAYLAALAVGPHAYLGCAWMSVVAAWYTVLLLPLAAAPGAVEEWRRWFHTHAPRPLGWLVYTSVLLVVCGEVGLRVYHVAECRGWLGNPAGPMLVEQLEAAEQATEAPAARPFRVAILGDAADLGDAKGEGYLARVRQMLPGLEIVLLEPWHAWSGESNHQVAERLSASRPDLVLTVFAACEGLTHACDGRDWFDWRQLELARRAISSQPDPDGPRQQAAAGDDFESFLSAVAPQLAACRTPIDGTMRARWQRTFSSLDDVLAICRARQVPVALVLVPSEFQVDRALCGTLVRRTGQSAAQFDVDLPQRRLAEFAETRRVPVLDLLPHLRLGSPSLYERNATVWNEHGHSAAASAIAHWLESRYGGQPSLAARVPRAP